MKIKEDSKDGASLTLRRLVEEEARYLSGEAFARFMDHLYERITTFFDSNEVSKNLGALRAIDELIDVTISENTSKVAKFSNYMCVAFETKSDPEILVLASKVLGYLARSGGAITADEVERQVKVALEWLCGERIEYRRLAAVLILKKIAENASTVFNVHVPEFVDAIWVPLRDPTLAIREKVVQALRACLRVIEKCETRWRVQCYVYFSLPPYHFSEILKDCFSGKFIDPRHLLLNWWFRQKIAENASTVFNVHVPEFVDAIWVPLRDPTLAIREKVVQALRACLRVIEKCETRYYRMFESTQDGLGRNALVQSIHGSLLAGGELLRNTGEFMMSRYREVAEIVLRYLEHRDRLVRLSITSLLPRIAHFLRDRFVTNYLTICMNHILHVLKIPAERASGFIALGKMAGALDGELINYLPTITSHLRDAVLSNV
ncbi:Serine/threonine-protein kinase TOR [Capsicum chinense]|nr:Serine/threonine-protein kinase TOR [Capsicum chinense]